VEEDAEKPDDLTEPTIFTLLLEEEFLARPTPGSRPKSDPHDRETDADSDAMEAEDGERNSGRRSRPQGKIQIQNSLD
jgi:hypothetical protein